MSFEPFRKHDDHRDEADEQADCVDGLDELNRTAALDAPSSIDAQGFSQSECSSYSFGHVDNARAH